MKKIIARYITLWVKLTANSFLVSLASRFSAFLFFLGKTFRFLFFGIFLLTILTKTRIVAGYTIYQAVFFFLTFNFLDTVTQLFFREVYRFRQLVVSGDFDLILVKPFQPLFRVLAGGADPLDLFMLIPYTAILVFVGVNTGTVEVGNIMLYILLLGNGFLIATGFHILVLALAIVTTEIDHAIMIYRDFTTMARFPVDMYRDPLRGIITYIIPIGLMMTFPVKAFLGLLSPVTIVFSFILGMAFFLVSIKVWRYALSRYSSASS